MVRAMVKNVVRWWWWWQTDIGDCSVALATEKIKLHVIKIMTINTSGRSSKLLWYFMPLILKKLKCSIIIWTWHCSSIRSLASQSLNRTWPVNTSQLSTTWTSIGFISWESVSLIKLYNVHREFLDY